MTTYLTPPQPGPHRRRHPRRPAPATAVPARRPAPKPLRPNPTPASAAAMNMLKKGPELKLPELKVPDFLSTSTTTCAIATCCRWSAILLVAIVAVPIVLSQSAPKSSERSRRRRRHRHPQLPPAPSRACWSPRAAPGLRDYRRRLAGMRAKDPFKQQYTGPAEESTPWPQPTASGGESGTLERTGDSVGTPRPRAPPRTAGNRRRTGARPRQADLLLLRDRRPRRPGGSQEGGQPERGGKATVRRNLPELTMLPSRETPAAIFMGSARTARRR